jgi:hypothetical protein
MKFQEKSLDWSQDMAEKVQCSSNKDPLIIHRLQPNLHRL